MSLLNVNFKKISIMACLEKDSPFFCAVERLLFSLVKEGASSLSFLIKIRCFAKLYINGAGMR